MPRLLPEVTTRNVVKMIISVTALSLAVAAIVSFANYDHRVTLDVDGRVVDVRTSVETVGELLADKNVEVEAEDKISAKLNEPIASGDRIEVRTAKPVTLVVDGEITQNTVHDWKVGDALKTLNVEPAADAHISADLDERITDRGISLVVSNPKKITVKADGKKRTLRTTAPTVAEVLAGFDVELGADDEVSHGLGSYVKPGQAVRVIRIEKVRRQEKTKIDFPEEVTDDASMFQGQTAILTAGKPGTAWSTVDLVLADGKVRERVVVSRDAVRLPITQVVARGTKDPGLIDGGVWDRLAQCESGGNWHINTGNGFYGGLQFSAATWRSVGGSGLPHENSKAEQIKRAKILQQRAGWGQWPACTKRLGLS